MLERFKVPKEDEIHVPHDGLRETVASIFEKMGVTPEDSELGADVLVSTDLRGVETHGVSNMLRSYVQGYSQGTLNPRPDWKVERESPATATIDADRGLAVILGPKAMQIAIEKARNVGMGAVTMYNAGHSGAIGHHAMLAAKADMVGMTATAGGLLVLPTFGAEPRFGTNPLAIAAPPSPSPSCYSTPPPPLSRATSSDWQAAWEPTCSAAGYLERTAILYLKKCPCLSVANTTNFPWAVPANRGRTRATASA